MRSARIVHDDCRTAAEEPDQVVDEHHGVHEVEQVAERTGVADADGELGQEHGEADG